MKSLIRQTLKVEFDRKDIEAILSDLRIGRQAMDITAYSPVTNMFLMRLKEFRGDYDRVGG